MKQSCRRASIALAALLVSCVSAGKCNDGAEGFENCEKCSADGTRCLECGIGYGEGFALTPWGTCIPCTAPSNFPDETCVECKWNKPKRCTGCMVWQNPDNAAYVTAEGGCAMVPTEKHCFKAEDITGKCIECQWGYYMGSKGNCRSCPKNCHSCTSPKNCTACAYGLGLSKGACLKCGSRNCPKCAKDKCVKA